MCAAIITEPASPDQPSRYIDSLRLDPLGHVALVVPLQRVPLVLVFFGELVVFDALALELERHRDGLRRHKETAANRFVQGVGVSRHAVLEVQ